MLRFEGNTAAFLLYAYVRTQSILRKVGAPACAVSEASLVLEAPSERALALKLARFDDLLHHVSATLMPHQLCAYLFELAECFHAFFRDCRVEGSAHQVSRVALCQASGNTLRTGLGLLGIPVLERM